jgi:hypothetical protein
MTSITLSCLVWSVLNPSITIGFNFHHTNNGAIGSHRLALPSHSVSAEITTIPVRDKDAIFSTFLGKFHTLVYPTEPNENEEDHHASSSSFVAAMQVPSFASTLENPVDGEEKELPVFPIQPISHHVLNDTLPNHGPTFFVNDILSPSVCIDLVRSSEALRYHDFHAGKNHHGALQIIVPETVASAVASKILPHVDFQQLYQRWDECDYANRLSSEQQATRPHQMLRCIGLNRRWRFYRYNPGGVQRFAPHIDVGFPPSGLSADGQTLVWDSTDFDCTAPDAEMKRKIVSRLTVLLYLNDNFVGGETCFYRPLSMCTDGGTNDNNSQLLNLEMIAAVKPKQGSCLILPQAVGERALSYARQCWPLHEGSPVLAESLEPKYVIRSDLIFAEENIHGYG